MSVLNVRPNGGLKYGLICTTPFVFFVDLISSCMWADGLDLTRKQISDGSWTCVLLSAWYLYILIIIYIASIVQNHLEIKFPWPLCIIVEVEECSFHHRTIILISISRSWKVARLLGVEMWRHAHAHCTWAHMQCMQETNTHRAAAHGRFVRRI